MTIYQMILSSSLFVQFVLVLLFLASVFSWAIAWKKWKEIKKVKEGNAAFLDIYNNNKKLNDILLQSKKIEVYGLAHLFRRGHEEFMRLTDASSKGGDPGSAIREHVGQFGMNAIDRSLQMGTNDVNEFLESKLSFLASIGTICPFVGLFGTVWGIINAFMSISEGGATLDALAPGIGEALITTALGLFAAIPAVIFYNIFNNENMKLNLKMETFSQEFINMLERLVINLK